MIRPTSECGEWASIWDPCGHDRVGAFQGASPPNSTARAGFWVGICLLSHGACCLYFPWVTHLEVPPVIATTFFKQTNKAPRGFHRDASECKVTPAFHDWLRQTCPSCFSRTPKGGCVLPSGAGLLMASQHFLYAFAWGQSVCSFIFRADLTHQPLEGPDTLNTACLKGPRLDSFLVLPFEPVQLLSV